MLRSTAALNTRRTALLPERLRSSGGTRRSCSRVCRVLDDERFQAVCAIDRQYPIPVARELVNSVTADIASVQMIVDLELGIQIQLLVEELQQPPKTASAHSTPPAVPSPLRQRRFLRSSMVLEFPGLRVAASRT